MNLLRTFLLILPFVVSISSSAIDADKMREIQALPEVHGDKFYYFGFGSNMLAKRIHIQNPTAVKIGPGKLENYRLDFNDFSRNWDGAPATIVPHPNRTVWGTVWEIDITNLADIDHQEGVHEGMYEAKSVPITLKSTGEIITSRAYLLTEQPASDFKSMQPEEIPSKRLPSKTYIQCLVKGAIESEIEPEYIEWLKSLKHNGVVAEKMSNFLELDNIELKS
ncbi:gamma-glutamylcyclotransferase [Stomoxys calcitrans]|uniref:gamma-glutamylcyclotransferase n=1 Tax=Stomoxys calcitrans TaxID=35570 RepID=A0A1I8PKM5_STOCA|nr:gamma-glutamylcyclotransferase [Stomoxys calcitrans]